jgi:hypothetical protein
MATLLRWLLPLPPPRQFSPFSPFAAAAFAFIFRYAIAIFRFGFHAAVRYFDISSPCFSHYAAFHAFARREASYAIVASEERGAQRRYMLVKMRSAASGAPRSEQRLRHPAAMPTAKMLMFAAAADLSVHLRPSSSSNAHVTRCPQTRGYAQEGKRCGSGADARARDERASFDAHAQLCFHIRSLSTDF